MRTVVAGSCCSGVLAAPAAAHDVDVDVVSSRADQVSGGDALIRIEARHRHNLRVFRNGADVTGAFERDGRDLVGLVDGLRLGRNRISVYDGWRRVAKQTSRTTRSRARSSPARTSGRSSARRSRPALGEPLVDNQEGDGFRVLAPDGTHRGLEPQLRRQHARRLALPPTSGGNLVPLPPGPLPADVATR